MRKAMAMTPVTGVSWYEAAAYAAFAGKRLPTLFHWFRAANTDDSHFLIPFSNFASARVRPAAESRALGSFGVLDMAGNLREWCWNTRRVSASSSAVRTAIKATC